MAKETSFKTGARVKNEPERIGALDAAFFPSRSKPAEDRVVKTIVAAMDSAHPGSGKSQADISRTLKKAIEQANKSGIKASQLPPEHKAFIARYAEMQAQRYQHHRTQTGKGLSGVEANQAYTRGLPGYLTDRDKASSGHRVYDDYTRKYTFARGDLPDRIVVDDTGKAPEARAGGKETPVGAYVPQVEFGSAEERRKAEAVNHRRIMTEGWGMSRTAADRLLKQGFDPTKTSTTIDATLYGINAPTVRRLQTHGFKVKNAPGMKKGESLSKTELRTGKLARTGSAVGDARAERQRGLFRSKRIYEDDGKGGAVPVDLEARYSRDTIKKATKKNTTGAVGKWWRRKNREADDKRLNTPLGRIERIEQIEAKRSIVNLQGKLDDATGSPVRRFFLLGALKTQKWVLLHKGWFSFLLVAALFFVPVIGLGTWAGWGIVAGAMAGLQFAANILVNIYNLVASFFIGIINLVGNVVVGAMEYVSRGALENYGLSATVTDADGETHDRIFSYTVPKIKPGAVNIPDIPKPSHFDMRTPIELLLSLFGIKFSFFNSLADWFRGGS